MSDRTLLGGGLAGLLSLPLVAVALLTGGLVVAVVALASVAALVAGTVYGGDDGNRECPDCGVSNDATDGRCVACGARL
jgi:hypothetical protein